MAAAMETSVPANLQKLGQSGRFRTGPHLSSFSFMHSNEPTVVAAGTAVMEAAATVAHRPRHPEAHAMAGRAALRRPVQDCLQDLRRACLCVQSDRRLLRRRSTPSISGMVSRLFLRHRLP